jgi:carboxyl-terminal processing protease
MKTGLIKFFIKIVWIFILLCVAGFVGYKIGIYKGQEAAFKNPPAVINEGIGTPTKIDFSIFWEAWHKLENSYIDTSKIDYQKMVYGAIEGMVKSLGDPYTIFFTPSQTESFNEELEGRYQGVGMVVGIKDNQLTVISPFKNTPAEKAGIKAGDKILKINDLFTADLTIDEAVKNIKGEKGTSVKLLIQREEWSEPKEFVVQRDVITIPTLEMENKERDIAVLKIYQFNKILPSEFQKAAREIINNGQKKLIIDLRDNPGGYLEIAQNIAGWFVPKGQVIVIQDEGEHKKKKEYFSEGPSIFSHYPTVVLINEGSASAAEILAGALRDQLGVKLVGKKSFGKGSVQEQITLSNRSSLKVTVARWLTPKGISLDKNGLTPDIEVSNSTSSQDVILEKAIEFLNENY